jgi:type II secretory pathway pseudopilin PulG
VDPSSLIFLVIVAIWAAYLLGHWVRRRDQLATLRSVDRFSDAMRVLERRPPTGLVHRRDPRRPDLLRPGLGDQARAKSSRGESSRGGSAWSGSSEAGTSRAEPGRRRPVVAQAPRRRAGPKPSGLTSSRRRFRGALAVATSLAVPVTWGLFAAGRAPWWAGVLSSGLFVAVLAGLRGAARRRQQLARRRADRARRGQAQARRQGRREVVGGVVAEHRARAGRRSAGPELAGRDDVGAERTRPRRNGWDTDQRRTADPVRSETDRSWQPVPVPPPTYTLKARAPYPPTGATEPSRPAEPGTGPAATVWPAVADPAGADPAGADPAVADPAVADRAAGSPVDARGVVRLSDDPTEPVATNPGAVVFDLNAILERRIASSG